MSDLLLTLVSLIEPIGIAVLLVYLYGLTHRKTASRAQNQVWMGSAFGLAAAFGMATPIVIADGTIIDMRNLFVGLAGAFLGWRGVIAALGIAAATRIGIGGQGAVSGVLGMSIAASMGLLWARQIDVRIVSRPISFATLATMISLHLCALVALPYAVAVSFLRDLGPQIILMNFAGTFLLSTLIHHENIMIGRTEALLSAATTDPLTKLLNRRSAVAQFEQVLSDGPMPRGVAMMCIDIDDFKAINDTHGHLAGDAVLIEVAARLSDCLRTGDIFARMSGDEFLIVLTNVNSEDSRDITERCRKVVDRSSVDYGDASINASISIGVVWSQRRLDFEDMRDAADAALYQAKAAGRNCAAYQAIGLRHIKPAPRDQKSVA